MNGNSGIGGIRNMGKEMEVKEEKTEEEKQKEQSLAIFKQSEEAIVAADRMLRGFEIKLEDEETRSTVTGPTGVVLGTAANKLLDSAAETNPDKRAHDREVGLTSLAEVGVGALKTLFAGERRRRAAGKEILRRKK